MKNKSPLKLGVNIDHVATIRQARKTTYPDILMAADICESAGADGITVHLREDRRHIQDADVRELRKRVKTRLNLEMANTPEIVAIALEVKPHEVCLVPERRAELTTEGGLDVAALKNKLKPTVKKLAEAGISVSLFVDPVDKQIRACASLEVPYIELHTGHFCRNYDEALRARTPQAKKAKIQAECELERLIRAAELAHSLGLKVNVGHGINLDNVQKILSIPYLDTLNIGHSIVARAVFVGLARAVWEMKNELSKYTGGRHATKRTSRDRY
jgi:pyridoxine 5-phosphate synthase